MKSSKMHEKVMINEIKLNLKTPAIHCDVINGKLNEVAGIRTILSAPFGQKKKKRCKTLPILSE
ncbi:hypothetical protein C0J52_03145 [Blattella germanica]|nr:hypothetical protein C0J52_03145 [Blattella germanica]